MRRTDVAAAGIHSEVVRDTPNLQPFIEGILSDLERSSSRAAFALRGAWSFLAWPGGMRRVTTDLDLVHLGDHPLPALALRETCMGTGRRVFEREFRAETITGQGWTKRTRLDLRACYGTASAPLTIHLAHHVGRSQHAERVHLNSDGRPGSVLCMSKEWMIAEKAALLVTYGPDHTRLQDLFDLRELSRSFVFDGFALAAAMRDVTADRDAERMLRRRDGYWEASLRKRTGAADQSRRWQLIIDRSCSAASIPPLSHALQEVSEFLTPFLESMRDHGSQEGTWIPGRGWRPSRSPDGSNRHVGLSGSTSRSRAQAAKTVTARDNEAVVEHEWACAPIGDHARRTAMTQRIDIVVAEGAAASASAASVMLPAKV